MSRRSLPLLVALAAGFLFPGAALGQDFVFNAGHARFDATGTGLAVVAGPDVLPAWRGGAGLLLHVADKPFALYSRASGKRELTAIVQQSSLVLELRGGFGFGGIADLGIVMPIAPVVVWGQGADGIPAASSGDGAAVGDLVLIPKVQILSPKKTKYVGLGVQIPVSLPTGQRAGYHSDAGVNLAVDILAEFRIWKLRVLANVSPIHVRPKVEYGDIARQFGLDWGAGLSFQMLQALALRAEAWGTVSYVGTESRTTAEWTFSVAMTPGEIVQLELGVGSGLGGFSTPGIRAFAGARFTIPGKAEPEAAVDIAPEAVEAPAAPEAVEAPAAVETVEEAATDAAETVQEAATDVAETVEEAATDAAETVEETATDAAETVEETATDAAETVEETATDAAETVEETASDVAETVEETATDAAETAEETATDAAETVEETAADVVEAVEEAAPEAPAAPLSETTQPSSDDE